MKMILEKLIRKENLTTEECRDAMLSVDSEVQMGALLALLRAKGETVEELLGCVQTLRFHAKTLDIPYPVLDIVGTGGDGAGTVNISTGSALLAARCGVPVVKHGSRAVTSLSGSADVLEILGFSFDDPKKSLEKTGFAFCLASHYHPLMLKVRAVRKSLAVPTLFNLLGPLLNPAGTAHLMIGVYQPQFVPIIAETLFRLGTKRSLIFHGHGLDELTCLGVTDALLVTEKGIEPFQIDPVKLGLPLCTKKDLQGGDSHENAMLIGQALTGSSPLSDTLVLNAAVGLFLYGRALYLEEGIAMARAALQRKSLKEALQQNPRSILAEIKRASPSQGKLGAIPDPAERASLYVQAGATAISVLTSSKFEGSLEDLGSVSKRLFQTQAPILRKDFLLEPIQIAQAAAHGADAVLLIAAFLKERTQEMLETAKKMGLEAIVEVHREEEFRYFQDAAIIAVNQRNLFDFSMHPNVHEECIQRIPKGAVSLAASGVSSMRDADELFKLGYDALLVGESLTRSEDPLQFLSSLRHPCS